ncbi:MAG: hypothetical protein HFI13_01835 [Lachnospiraceae bacterium]|nr:hypothetical protein [Lachnospiraceae bacterium]
MNVCERDFFIQLYELMEKPELLMSLKENMTRYFRINGYRNIAVYGIGRLGTLILKNIDIAQLESICTIDENKAAHFGDIETINIHELADRKKIDVVLITPLLDYPQIEVQICSMCEIPVISAKELMCDMINQSLFPDDADGGNGANG